MAKIKKKTFKEEKAEWNIALTELIMEVEKSKSENNKGKYDFLVSLESAQKCL